MNFVRGELVGVPCFVQNGAFPSERLVKVESQEGAIWGFVDRVNLQMDDDAEHEQGYVKSAVVDEDRESVVVKMFGSFFTTAVGLASVRRDCLMRLAAP